MRVQTVPITPQRFARLLLGAWLWLLKYALFLCVAQTAEPWRRKAQRGVRDLILLRAATLMAKRRPRARYRPTPPPDFARAPSPNILRAVCGAYVRKRLRARSPGAAVAAIMAALQDIEALARRIVRRLPRGLTRIRPLRMTQTAPVLVFESAPSPRAVGADTS